MADDRTQRILKIVNALKSAHDIKSLAVKFGVSRKTIFRDLRSIRAAGVRVVFDRPRRRYCLPDMLSLSPVYLTPAEAISLVLLGRELAGPERIPHFIAAHSAAAKIEQILPLRVFRQLSKIKRTVKVGPLHAAKSPTSERHFQRFLKARIEQLVVDLKFPDGDNEIRSTQFQTYALYFTTHRWFVVGFSSAHGRIEAFSLSSILSAAIQRKKYRVPDSFDVTSHFGNAWGLVVSDGPSQEVIIRFNRLAAASIAEFRWHPTQQMKIEMDGSLTFRVRVTTFDELVWWILGFGDQAEVLHPTSLRDFVARRIRNMVELYRDSNESADFT